MNKRLIPALLLSGALLTACGPKGGGADPSSPSNGLSRPPVAGDLLPPVDSGSAEGSPDYAVPAPDPERAAQWRSEYRYDIDCLGQSLFRLAEERDMLSYARWPAGREQVSLDTSCLLFSGPAAQSGSQCAAVGLELHAPTTVDALRESWGDALVFEPDDPVAGPCWRVTDGGWTYRFRTGASQQALAEDGFPLVISLDSLLPQTADSGWLSPPTYWLDLLAEEPGPVWDGLLSYTGALLQSAPPAGATEAAPADILDAFYAARGLGDPDTGVQYLSSDPSQEGLWDGIVVPASLVFGSALPGNPDQVMDALNTPFSWEAYNLTGYWFYLDQYKVCLTSDVNGGVSGEDYFLIRWGDNAGP